MNIDHEKHPNKVGTDGIEVPRCENPECKGRHAQNTGHKTKDGKIRYRTIPKHKELYGKEGYACHDCHFGAIAEKRGVTLAELRIQLLEEAFQKSGFDNLTDWRNRNHSSLKFRKNYCENVDGRLGFKCTTNIKAMLDLTNGEYKGFLDVDHIDGNPYNEPEDGSNFQTLCKCCHALKGHLFEDHKSPGRKAGAKACFEKAKENAA